MKRKLSPRVLFGLVGGLLLVYAVFGWFVLVSPKRSEAAALKQEVAVAEQRVAAARAAAARRDDTEPLAVADIFRLATAMPGTPDMPGILLELSRLAEETGIEFQSIAPQESTAAGDFQQVPISLVFDGNFYELSDFLFRLRTLVGVHAGELHARGRLFSVKTLDFAESGDGFPELIATMTVNAYVFGTEVPASTVPPVPPPVEPPPAEGAGAPEASP